MPEQSLSPSKSLRGSDNLIPAAPVEVGNQRQLLMDDHVVEDCWACCRTVHQPSKHPDNPVITPTQPWEGDGAAWVSTLYDHQRRIFRMWAKTNDHSRRSQPLAEAGVYYESDDGIHWRTPHLGLVEYDGNLNNNIFLGTPETQIVSFDIIDLPDARQAQGRYALLYSTRPTNASPDPAATATAARPQQRVAFSEDGINWQDQGDTPIFFGHSDTHNNLVYVRHRDVFGYYRRALINAESHRRIAYSESADLIHWTQPKIILTPDEIDPPMLYGMTVDYYHGLYLGFLQMFYCDESVRLDKSLMVDIQLAWSRDGMRWQRHPARPLFLGCGQVGSYDWAQIRLGKGIVEHDDKIYLFYCGFDWLHRKDMIHKRYTCLATLRRDGFVSLDASGDGYVLTKPLMCPGGRLHINATTKDQGAIHVAIRRGDGQFDGEWLDEWNFDRAVVFTGDSTDCIVNWKAQTNLNSLKDKSIRLQFWLDNAQLYSFWFE